MALRTVGVRLTAEIAGYQRKLRQAGRDTKDFVGEMDKAAKAGHLDAVADSAGMAGLAIGGAAAYAVKASMDFEKAMSGIKAATHASAGELDALRKAALQAGKDTSYSATEAAGAITELSKAGVATSDVLGGGLKGALDLAAAGQMDVGEAAEVAASALTQFKLKGKDVPHVADLLAAAAGKAQGTVHDMGMALNQAGLVAAQTGLSIEETTGGLAAFASAGLTGSDAGTSFKQMLLMLQAPSGATRKLMEELGISAYDASGQFVGLTALAQQLRDKMGHLTPELRANAMAQIFGADAVRGASILYEQGQVGIQGWIDKVNDAGYASETAKIQTDNLIGDLERLKGSLETLAIESGGGANSGLRVITQSANALVDQFALLPSGISGTITVLGLLSGALLLGASGWVKMRRSNAEALEELRNTGPAGERAAAGLQTTTKWAGRAAAGFVGLQVAGAAASAAFGNSMNPQIDALTMSLQDWATTGKKGGEATRLLGDDFENLRYDLSTLDSGFWTGLGNGASGVVESFTGLGSVMDQSLQHARERLQSIDAALSSMVQGGKSAEAAALFSRLAAEAKKSGVSVDELKKGLPQYAAAVQTAGSASATSAGQIDQVAAAAEQTKEKVEELQKAFSDLFSAQMTADRAALKLAQSTVALKEELSKGTKTLALNSEEGRKNRTAVLDQLAAIEDLREARVRQGVTLDEATKKYTKDVAGLRKSMLQAGYTKKEVDGLIGSYRKIPDAVNTKVDIKGEEGVNKALDKLLVKQYALAKGLSPAAAASSVQKDLDRNRQRGYHAGGWTGPGAKYDEAGIVHADEFVIRKESRRAIEARAPGMLDEMNATGQVPPGYAAGGQVWPFPVNANKTRIPSWSEVASKVAGNFGNWPSSPSAQRGDSGVWRKIMGLVRASGIPYDFGNAYRPGDPKWHGSGRAIDFMGYNQDRLAQFFMNRQSQVLELIHRTRNRDYGITRGRYNAMPTQWPLHRNHLHIAMQNGGMIREPIVGIGASGATYSFGENGVHERVTPVGSSSAGRSGMTTVNVTVNAPVGSSPVEIGRQVVSAIGDYLNAGGALVLTNGTKALP